MVVCLGLFGFCLCVSVWMMELEIVDGELCGTEVARWIGDVMREEGVRALKTHVRQQHMCYVQVFTFSGGDFDCELAANIPVLPCLYCP